MAVFALRDAIELRCMRRSSVMGDTTVREEGAERDILATIIGVESANSLVKLVFNK